MGGRHVSERRARKLFSLPCAVLLAFVLYFTNYFRFEWHDARTSHNRKRPKLTRGPLYRSILSESVPCDVISMATRLPASSHGYIRHEHAHHTTRHPPGVVCLVSSPPSCPVPRARPQRTPDPSHTLLAACAVRACLRRGNGPAGGRPSLASAMS